MSDHVFTQEHIAAYVAGGLDAADAERVDVHVRSCSDCATALDRAQVFDCGVSKLFALERPAAAFEDHLIQTLRTPAASVSPARLRWGWQRRLAMGLAVSVGLGITGASLSVLADGGRLPLPGELRFAPWHEASAKSSTPRDGFPAVQAADAELSGRGFMSADRMLKSRTSGRESESLVAADPKAIHDPETMARALSGEMRGLATTNGADAAVNLWRDVDGSTPAGAGERTKFSADGRRVVSESTESTDFGLDPNGRTNHRVERLTDLSIPGPIAPDDSLALGRNDYYKFSPQNSTVNALNFGKDVSKVDGNNDEKKSLSNLTAARPSSSPAQSEKKGSVYSYFVPGTHKPVVVTTTKSVPTLSPKDPLGDAAYGNKPPRATEPALTPANGQSQPGSTNNSAPPEPAASVRKIIRTGDIEFEVDSFDPAQATVARLVLNIKGAFLATMNSEKLPNGKMKGSIVVRIPPEHLDAFVLDLRKELGKVGELKGQRIGSQDITKQYFDLESRLKAARTMEQRLLQIIKDGKGEIKQLLEAEKELGIWRTRIEEMEGEIRYFASQVSLSTLTVTLAEKDIRVAAGLTESERVQTGIEVEEVEQAHRDAMAAVTEAKGRVTRSEVKQLAAGQFNATLNFEVAPEQAGAMRDRLKQLGRTARLEVDRVQQAEGGTPQRDSKVKRGDTQFLVQFYNLANITPRETVVLQLAAPDVPAAHRAVQDAISRTKGRVLASRLDEQDRRNITSTLDFEVRRADEPQLQTALTAAGATVARNVHRTPESDNVTDAKVLFRTTIISVAQLHPREIRTFAIEVKEVDAAVAAYAAHIAEAKGRVVDSNITHQRSGQVTARVVYEVPLTAAPTVAEKIKASGVVRVQQNARDPQAPEGDYATARIDVTLANTERIVAADEGLGPQIKSGLTKSASFLLTSLSWVIFGLCAVVPWAAVGYGAYRIGRWLFRSPAAQAPKPPAAE